jgi:CubicO group peptidase (beta-lactamase class C family)
MTPDSRVDDVIDRAIAEHRIVGAVALVSRDGEPVYARAAGYADRETRTPMVEDTLFRLSSVTKPYVCAAVMRLVERGDLNLADEVTRWLPHFQPQLLDGTTPVITVRQLLTHTAGLSYGFAEPADSAYHRNNVSDGLDQPGLSLEENLKRLANAPLVYAPGASWRYSLAIDVLGAIAAKASRQTLPDLVRETVTGPLAMERTRFTVERGDDLATPYFDAQPEPKEMWDGVIVPMGELKIRFAPSRATNPNSYPSGGVGMVGTAGDLLKFLEAIRLGGAPMLKPSTVHEMMKDQIVSPVEAMGPGWGFGYGWAVLRDPQAAQTRQHAGTIQWGGVYGHNWFVDPASKLTVVAFTNTAVEGMIGRFTTELRDAVY